MLKRAGLVASRTGRGRSSWIKPIKSLALTWVNRTVPGQTYEMVLEWNYGFEVTRWFTFQPDIQWVVRPGATGQIPNALVLGAQAVIDF